MIFNPNWIFQCPARDALQLVSSFRINVMTRTAYYRIFLCQPLVASSLGNDSQAEKREEVALCEIQWPRTGLLGSAMLHLCDMHRLWI